MSFREIGENIEQYFIEVIREKKHGKLASVIMGILFFASRFYNFVATKRFIKLVYIVCSDTNKQVYPCFHNKVITLV